MAATNWISVRLDDDRFARMNELGTVVGGRTALVLSAVDLADAVIRFAAIGADHGGHGDDVEDAIMIAIKSLISAMSVQNDHDPGCTPGRGEILDPLVGKKVA